MAQPWNHRTGSINAFLIIVARGPWQSAPRWRNNEACFTDDDNDDDDYQIRYNELAKAYIIWPVPSWWQPNRKKRWKGRKDEREEREEENGARDKKMWKKNERTNEQKEEKEIKDGKKERWSSNRVTYATLLLSPGERGWRPDGRVGGRKEKRGWNGPWGWEW